MAKKTATDRALHLYTQKRLRFVAALAEKYARQGMDIDTAEREAELEWQGLIDAIRIVAAA